jgi:hypothetical protein
MSAQSTLEITRRSAITDRARAYKVRVDGRQVGSIRNGKTESFPIEPGSHEVMLQVDWGWSPPVTIQVVSGTTTRLTCGPRANLLTGLYYATFGRKKYLRLEPAD